LTLQYYDIIIHNKKEEQMQQILNYWPLMLMLAWVGYRWWNTKKIQNLMPHLRKKNATLVDVRSSQEYAGGHAPHTLNIPLPELSTRINEIPKSAPVVVCCASGARSGIAKAILKKQGYSEVYNIGTWTKMLQ
jgi:phage shock protein E